MRLLVALAFAICIPTVGVADLGRLKRYVLRDCDQAEAAFNELTPQDQPEVIRYLGEVFRLNLGAVFEAPLVAGNLADPADIWRSLSGESEVASKICALRLARRIGANATDALASAVPLLANPLTPYSVKRAVVSALIHQLSLTPARLGGLEYPQLRLALRAMATQSPDPVAAQVARVILVYSIDPTLVPAGIQTAHAGVSEAGAATPPTALTAKQRKDALKALASTSETEREQALALFTSADLKTIEGFRNTAPRPEKVAASLAISHFGGQWLIDSQSSKAIDCAFAASFVPLTISNDSKRREDFERLVARCLLVGRDEFLAQLVLDPSLISRPAIAALLPTELPLTTTSAIDKLALVAARVAGNADTSSHLKHRLESLFEGAPDAPKATPAPTAPDSPAVVPQGAQGPPAGASPPPLN